MDADEVFAASLPGGYLFLSAPLIAQTADGSLLSGILAHQAAHIAGTAYASEYPLWPRTPPPFR